MFNKPLYKNKSIDPKETEENDLDVFCKAMGWTNISGIIPKKDDSKSKRHWEQRDIDLTDVHKDLAKTNVTNELKNNVLIGIQAKKEVKVLSEREAHRQRKVIDS